MLLKFEIAIIQQVIGRARRNPTVVAVSRVQRPEQSSCNELANPEKPMLMRWIEDTHDRVVELPAVETGCRASPPNTQRSKVAHVQTPKDVVLSVMVPAQRGQILEVKNVRQKQYKQGND